MKKVSKSLTEHLERVNELASRLELGDRKASRIDIDILLDALRNMYDDVYALKDENENLPAEMAESEKESEPAKDETPMAADEVQSTKMSVLMVDNEAEAVFAKEPEVEAAADFDSNQPSMEELEGQQNDELFEDIPTQPTIEKTSVQNEPIAEEPATEAPAQPEQPTEEKADETMQPKTEEPDETAQPNEPEATKPAQQPQPSLFDYFKTTTEEKTATRTLADTLGAMHGSAETKAIGNKVKDLRTVININDKFSFMNELFRNNMKGYNDFILRLNAIDNRDEALQYVDTIAQQYNWDNESMTVKTFYSIFDRKF